MVSCPKADTFWPDDRGPRFANVGVMIGPDAEAVRPGSTNEFRETPTNADVELRIIPRFASGVGPSLFRSVANDSVAEVLVEIV